MDPRAGLSSDTARRALAEHGQNVLAEAEPPQRAVYVQATAMTYAGIVAGQVGAGFAFRTDRRSVFSRVPPLGVAAGFVKRSLGGVPMTAAPRRSTVGGRCLKEAPCPPPLRSASRRR